MRKGLCCADLVGPPSLEKEQRWATQDFHIYRTSHDNPELGWMVDNPPTPEDMVLAEEEVGEKNDLVDRLQEARKELTDQEKEVIEGLYDLDLKPKELAARMSITPGRVSQLKKSAIKKLQIKIDGQSVT